MEFSREGQHTIKCVITEEEILGLGFSMDEIMGNGERTQEFMNQIFDLAEQKFETKFDMGIKTVRADFHPDHTLTLTFSEHPSSGGMMDHLKDIVNGLLNSIPSEKWEEIKAAKEQQAIEDKGNETRGLPPDMEKATIIYKFKKLDTVTRFAKQVNMEEIPYNCLYKCQSEYYLVVDMLGLEEDEVLKLSVLADEYAYEVQVGSERWAFLEEHGDLLMKEEAIEGLKML